MNIAEIILVAALGGLGLTGIAGTLVALVTDGRSRRPTLYR